MRMTTTYDLVNPTYDQDAVNGFTPSLLERLVGFVNPCTATSVLDAMGGNGNFTQRLWQHCARHTHVPPALTMLDLANVQVHEARRHLADTTATVLWGNVLTLDDYDTGRPLATGVYDRVIIKSGTHEIPLADQHTLATNVYTLLKPGGLFINLGLIFEDVQERDEFATWVRLKDSLAGLDDAVTRRHFLLREEFYPRLEQAGFVDVHGGYRCAYVVRSEVMAQVYFPPEVREQYHTELQVQQIRSPQLRRRGRLCFDAQGSVLTGPAVITVARKPPAGR